VDEAVSKLIAAEQIGKLKARYFRFIDTKEFEHFGELFSADATIDFPAAEDAELTEDGTLAGPTRGREEIVATIRDGLDGVTSVHQGQMAEIEITSPRTASAIWSMEDRLWFPREAGWKYRQAHGYGHYHEEYELGDGRWRIRSLVLTRLQMVTEPW